MAYKIDEALRKKLIEAGMFDKLRELEGLGKRTGFFRNYGSALGRTTRGVAEGSKSFGTELGGDIGRAIFSRTKGRRQLQDLASGTINKRLERQLMERIRYAKTREEAKKWADKLKALRGTVTPDQLLQTLTAGRTKKDIFTDAGKLALTASIGFKPSPAGITGKLATGSTKAGQVYKGFQAGRQTARAQKLANLTRMGRLGQRAIRTGKDVGFGGAFGALEAQSQDKDLKGTLKMAGLYGGVAAATPLVLGGLGKLIGKAGGAVKRKLISPAGQKTLLALEKAAAGGKTARGVSYADDFLDDVLVAKPTFKQKSAQGILKTIRGVKSIEQKFVDRYAPLKSVEHKLAQGLGRDLTDDELVYMQARTTSAVGEARAGEFADELGGKLIKPFKNELDDIENYAVLKDLVDRAQLGQKIAGGKTKVQAITALKDFITKKTPEQMTKIRAGQKLLVDLGRKNLQELVRAGLISEKAYIKMALKYPNHVPHNVIFENLDDVVQKSSFGQSLQATIPITKAVGSVRPIDRPIVSLIQRTPGIYQASEANKTLTNIIKVSQTDTGKKIIPEITPIANWKNVTEKGLASRGLEKVTVFDNGVKKAYAVPKDIGVAIKNLDTLDFPRWLKWVAKPADLLRAGATKYNISFSIPNWARDVQTAKITAGLTNKGFIEGMLRGATDKKIYQQYIKSGGYGASILQEYSKPGQFVEKLQSSMGNKIARNLNPLKMINKVNTAVESSTRLAVFQEGLKNGMTQRAAAFQARNATIDFAKMGTWMRPINKVIPFLNARLQGGLNIIAAAAKNPESFARVQMYTAAIPTLVLNQWNSQFESYKNIPQYMKNRYWNIMTGEVDGTNSQGDKIKIPQFASIVKGEPQQLVSNPIQHFLEKSQGIDPRNTWDMVADTVGSLSPLNFQSYDNSFAIQSLISNFGPLATITSGLAFNVDPYSGQDIIPQDALKAKPEVQYKKTTPESAKDLGKIMNVSPAQVDFILGAFGGLPTDVMDAFDLARGEKPESYSGTTFGTLSRTPIARRFIREAGDTATPERQEQYKLKEEIEKDITTEKLLVKRKANDFLDDYVKIESKEDRLKFLQEKKASGDIDEETFDKMFDLKKYRDSVEVLKKTDSSELRARYIYDRIQTMKTTEAKKEYLSHLKEKKILTEKVFSILQLLSQKYGKIFNQ